MGRFVDAALPSLTETEIGDLELLLEAPDRDVYAWLTGEIETPAGYDTPLLRRMRDFHTHATPLHR